MSFRNPGIKLSQVRGGRTIKSKTLSKMFNQTVAKEYRFNKESSHLPVHRHHPLTPVHRLGSKAIEIMGVRVEERQRIGTPMTGRLAQFVAMTAALAIDVATPVFVPRGSRRSNLK